MSGLTVLGEGMAEADIRCGFVYFVFRPVAVNTLRRIWPTSDLRQVIMMPSAERPIKSGVKGASAIACY